MERTSRCFGVFNRTSQSNDLEVELIIVDDDSQDGTEEIVHGLRMDYNVRAIVRRNVPRGLSHSVLDGLRDAHEEVVVVMDADLSHPPVALPALVKDVLSGSADFTMASRYMNRAAIQKVRGRFFTS